VLRYKPGTLPGSTALAQARAAGAFTSAHEAFRAASARSTATRAADDKQLAKTIARYGRVDLLMIAELGYMKLDRRGAELLFQVLTEREEKNSIAIASNQSFSGWTDTFTDPRLCAAIVDRLTYHGTISKPAPTPTASPTPARSTDNSEPAWGSRIGAYLRVDPEQPGFHLEGETESRLAGPRSQRLASTTVASADPLSQRHDDPLRSAHVGHAPDVLVLADAADQPVAVRGQPVGGRLKVVDLEGHVAQPQLVGHRCGRSRLVVGPGSLDSSNRVPPSGGRSMTISVRESGMPTTVSRKSPSTNNRVPSTSRPSPTKNAVTVSRSATVMPTWSKRRTYDIGIILQCSSCRSSPGTDRTADSRH
jgi:hypothetical protein